jgi:hypothetical protein
MYPYILYFIVCGFQIKISGLIIINLRQGLDIMKNMIAHYFDYFY